MKRIATVMFKALLPPQPSRSRRRGTPVQGVEVTVAGRRCGRPHA